MIQVLILSAICASAISVAVFVGHHQPTPEWAALLHLTDCELPCWIGIVPGKTTMGEAQELIRARYGADRRYVIEDGKDISNYIIASKTDNLSLEVNLGAKSQPGSATVIDWVAVDPRDGPHPTIADFYGAVGDPENWRFAGASGVANWIDLVYSRRKLVVSLSNSSSFRNRITFNLPVNGVMLLDPFPSENGFVAHRIPWAGFRDYKDPLKP